jgi:4a-hydroxytetrahydrobiopterin dehydratase
MPKLHLMPTHLNWLMQNNSLTKTFHFASFEQAMEFMQTAAAGISRMNHHPEWCNVYKRVDVTLRTHDAGNTVTNKDHELAAWLDEVYHPFTQP